jgi:hypothetical protein
LRRHSDDVKEHLLDATSQPPATAIETGPRDESRRAQLLLYIDLYKHHHEIVVKASIIYSAVIGFLAGFVLRSEVQVSLRLWGAALIALTSGVAFAMSFATRRNFDSLYIAVAAVATDLELHIPQSVFAQSRASLLTIQLGSAILGASGLVTLLLVFANH